MIPEKCMELIEAKKPELAPHKLRFLERIEHRIKNNQEILGKERVQLGKLYKELFGVWPFDDTQFDLDRRQSTATFIVTSFEDAVESGILELPASESNFVGKIQKFLEDKKQIEKKDFNYLFFLSKKYKQQLSSFMPSKTGKQNGKK